MTVTKENSLYRNRWEHRAASRKMGVKGRDLAKGRVLESEKAKAAIIVCGSIVVCGLMLILAACVQAVQS